VTDICWYTYLHINSNLARFDKNRSEDISYDDQIETVPSLYIDKSIIRITVSVSYFLL